MTHAFLMLLVLFATGAYGHAQTNGIRDDAPFFSADAVKQADTIIRQLRTIHQQDLRIETFAEVPRELQARFQQQGKTEFFEHWVAERAAAQHVDGVYILVCKMPKRVQVWVGKQTVQTLFTVADRDALARLLADRFRQNQFDAGLLEGIRFIQRQMLRHSEDGEAPVALVLAPEPVLQGSARPGCVNGPDSMLLLRGSGDLP